MGCGGAGGSILSSGEFSCFHFLLVNAISFSNASNLIKGRKGYYVIIF